MDKCMKMDSGPQGLYGGSLYLLFFFSKLKRKENAQRHYAFEVGMIPSEPK